MLPTDFPERNKVYVKPPDMTDEQCMDLPVWEGPVPVAPNPDGTPRHVYAVISCWKFNKEDLERVNETGCIWLNIFCNGMPPVELRTDNPFDNG